MSLAQNLYYKEFLRKRKNLIMLQKGIKVMNNFENYFRYVIAGVGTGITWLLGAWDLSIIILASFIAFDYLTGVVRAFVNKTVSSNIGLKGIARKGSIFIVLMVAVMLDRLLNTGTWVFRTLVCYFYIANEGISLLENCVGLGAPVPDALKNALMQLKEGEKKEIK